MRVSKARAAMVSPEIQRYEIEQGVARRGGKIVAWCEDIDVSGRSFARAGITEALGLVSTGRADGIAVWTWSRFGRNMRDALLNIDAIEQADGTLVAVKEDFDTSTIAGRFGRGVFLLMAELMAEQIGERWREVQSKRVRDGLPANGHARFGYLYEGGRFTPDPVSGPVLTEFYRRYVAGHSVLSIVRYANSTGLLTARTGRKGGVQWARASLRSVMDTGFAAGLLRTAGGFEPGAHEPIITKDMWDAYVVLRESRRLSPRRDVTVKHMLARLVRCGLCGGTLYRHPYDDDRVAYRCRTKVMGKSYGSTSCPGIGQPRISKVDAQVMVWLRAQVADQEERAAAAVARKQAVIRTQAAAKDAQTEVDRLVEARARLAGAFAEGHMDTEPYREADTRLAERLAAARARAAQHQVTRYPTPKQFEGIMQAWDGLSVADRNLALRQVIDHVDVMPGPVVTVVPVWDVPVA